MIAQNLIYSKFSFKMSSDPQNTKLNHLKEKQSKSITYLNKSSAIFFGLNFIVLLGTLFFSVYLLALSVIFVAAYFVFYSKYGQKKFSQFKIYQQVKPYLKASKSLNHATTLIGKFIIGMPLKQNENEITTFNEIKDHFGKKWPFMVKVKDTRNVKLTVEGNPCTCISSYNYLDLGRNEEIQKAAVDAANSYSSGNHGPRMLCGNLQILEDLEAKISKFLNKEAALVFSSGFLACMSTISGIARKGDLLLMDKLNHASLKTGAKTCSASVVYFKHNDFEDAERIIKKHKFNRLILVIEGIYSMDGDIGNLPVARKLCDKYKGLLVIDEAHSLGTLGKTGRGTAEHFNFVAEADIICGTFTKSVSSVGGFLACSREIREYYTFYAPGAVFSAPLSAYHAGAAIKSFELIEENPQLVQKLQKNSDYLRKKFRDNGFNIGDTVTCVIPVIFRDINQVIEMHSYLLSRGFFTAAVMAPACPLETPRFRICSCASDSIELMDQIIQLFLDAQIKFPESERVKMLIDTIKK